MLRRLFTLLTPLFLTLGCSQAEDAAKNVDPKAAQALIADQKATVLDVRTPEEFAEGHIPNAKNVDFFSKSFRETLEKLDKDAPIVMHCQSGGRSGQALPIFKEMGFTKVFHMNGGFSAWSKAGLPVAK